MYATIARPLPHLATFNMSSKDLRVPVLGKLADVDME